MWHREKVHKLYEPGYTLSKHVIVYELLHAQAYLANPGDSCMCPIEYKLVILVPGLSCLLA